MDFVYIRTKNSHFLTAFREKGHGSRKFGIKPLKKVPILQKMKINTESDIRNQTKKTTQPFYYTTRLYSCRG